ncbi:MAG: hypothetical protein ACPGYT_10805, partial [Nitrospirales bacterium]
MELTKEHSNGSVVVAADAPVKISPKDAPSVERALSRSKLYLLLSWSYLFPEDDEFLDYLQSGEFVEDGRAALENLTKSLENIGGSSAQESIGTLAGHLDNIQEWVESEGSNWNLQDLRDDHRRVFSNVISLDCPPYETLF